eukprot:PhF_6_TR30588/c0_g1_i2/m.44999
MFQFRYIVVVVLFGFFLHPEKVRSFTLCSKIAEGVTLTSEDTLSCNTIITTTASPSKEPLQIRINASKYVMSITCSTNQSVASIRSLNFEFTGSVTWAVDVQNCWFKGLRFLKNTPPYGTVNMANTRFTNCNGSCFVGIGISDLQFNNVVIDGSSNVPFVFGDSNNDPVALLHLQNCGNLILQSVNVKFGMSGCVRINGADTVLVRNVTSTYCQVHKTSPYTVLPGPAMFVWSVYKSFTIIESVFAHSNSFSHGGCVDVYEVGKLSVTNVQITNCTAPVDGGGVSIYNVPSVDFTNVVIRGAYTPTTGGCAVFHAVPNVTFINVVGEDCGGALGGCVSIAGSQTVIVTWNYVTMRRCDSINIKSNTAAVSIVGQTTATTVFRDVTIAPLQGGCLYVSTDKYTYRANVDVNAVKLVGCLGRAKNIYLRAAKITSQFIVNDNYFFKLSQTRSRSESLTALRRLPTSIPSSLPTPGASTTPPASSSSPTPTSTPTSLPTPSATQTETPLPSP